MKRTLRILIPAALLLVPAAGALVVTQPWDDGDSVQEAAAGTVEYRLCDTVITGPPPPVPPSRPAKDYITVSRWLEQADTSEAWPGDWKPAMEVRLRLPSSGEQSLVSIDPASATILEERYSLPAHSPIMDTVLNTLRQEPLVRDMAPWPYTQTQQVANERQRVGPFEIRPPDPGSGIVTGHYLGNRFDGTLSQGLIVGNCRSTMFVGWEAAFGEEGKTTVSRHIHPEDDVAFQRFLDEVVVKGID